MELVKRPSNHSLSLATVLEDANALQWLLDTTFSHYRETTEGLRRGLPANLYCDLLLYLFPSQGED